MGEVAFAVSEADNGLRERLDQEIQAFTGPAVTWPLPRGSATELVSGRRPTWEDATHVLLTIPHGDIPAIRVDATTGATERLRLDRHGQGERGQYGEGTEFGVEGFVEPFQLPGVTRHPS